VVSCGRSLRSRSGFCKPSCKIWMKFVVAQDTIDMIIDTSFETEAVNCPLVGCVFSLDFKQLGFRSINAGFIRIDKIAAVVDRISVAKPCDQFPFWLISHLESPARSGMDFVRVFRLLRLPVSLR